MEDIKAIMARLERMSQEISDMMKILIQMDIGDKNKREKAWKCLLDASDEVTRLWKGPSAVKEIKCQREKKW